MAVVAEVFAFVLEFDADALPAVGADLALGFAVGESLLDIFDEVAEVFGEHAEEEDNTLFVEGFVPQPGEGSGIAANGAVASSSGPGFAAWSFRSGVGTWRLAAGSRHGPGRSRSWEKRQNIRPFLLASRELTKCPRHRRPAPESLGHRARVVPCGSSEHVPREHSGVFPHRSAPVFQQSAVVDPRIERTGVQPGS